MKKVAFLGVLLATTTAFGAMVDADMMELRATGSMDFNNPRGVVETDIGLGLGYFIRDDIQVGGLINFGNDGSEAGFGLGAYSEILFDMHYAAAPFLGGALMYRFGEYYPANHLLFEINGGVKVFLTEYLAVSGMIFFDLATDDVYVSDGDTRKYDSGMRLGLSVYF